VIAFFRKLLWLTRRRTQEEELREEIEFHLSEEAEQGQADGLALDEARWAARRSLGNLTSVKEDVRAVWGWIWVERFWQDLRYAARGLVKNPVFTTVAVLSLAIGIGATATIFSVFEAVFWHGVTAQDVERLRHVEIGEGRVSYRQYQELASGGPMLSGLAAHEQTSFSFGSGSELEKVSGEVVSANFFSMLGVGPALGGVFTQDENQAQVVVLSHSFWERHFHGDKSVRGRVIELNGEGYSVVGVLSKEYRSIHGYGIAPEIYVPIGSRLADNEERRWELIARLKDGVTVSQAEAALRARVQQWRGRAADKIQMYPLTGIVKIQRDGAPVEWTVFFAFLLLVAALVLLIACANVAGLLIARGVNRSREIVVRLALGAARYRLLQQLLTESLALGVLGCGGGIVLHVWLPGLSITFKSAPAYRLHWSCIWCRTRGCWRLQLRSLLPPRCFRV
jgi:macrolide transport system ATP-binding/permease protein